LAGTLVDWQSECEWRQTTESKDVGKIGCVHNDIRGGGRPQAPFKMMRFNFKAFLASLLFSFSSSSIAIYSSAEPILFY
jgi:hypothetical protein